MNTSLRFTGGDIESTEHVCEIVVYMFNMSQPHRPAKPAHFLLSMIVFALTYLIATAHLVLPLDAQPPAARPPISPVQLEKLLRVIDKRGENVRLDDRIAAGLALGDGIIIRQATATDPVARQSYFFAAIPATGQYLVGTHQPVGSDIFLIDPQLRLIAGVTAGAEIQKIPLPEAGKRLQDILVKFEAFLEMN